jgi:(1->4)-alpha-D-glucan 1-alpha-D-glucosylmutase
LVPILGDHYGRVLDRREIKLKRQGGDFVVTYFDNELPAAPRSLPLLLRPAALNSGSDYLAFLADSLTSLPASWAAEQIDRHRDKEMIRVLLERLFNEVPFIAETVDSVIKEVNQNVDRLDAFLERQNYRLAFWRTAEQDLGYRRFFDVNTLVGLRIEDPQVFADTHALIVNWLREGVLDGIRIDHPDGLRDPKQYFDRLRAEAPDVWILAEKILEPGEELRPSWPIDGTTGYDYMNLVTGLFVDRKAEPAISKIYSDFTSEPIGYQVVTRDKKNEVLRNILGSDVNRIGSLFLEICEAHRDRRDFTRRDVIRALRELVACFSVYRTYVVPERGEIEEEDRMYVQEAVDAAKRNRPDLDPDLFDFMGAVLLLKEPGARESEFVMSFQQFTSPAMAKGVEDTVFYCFNRLISLNEVGGDPGLFGTSPESYHEFCAHIRETRPRTMLAASTHDTKRGEDVRLRINLLSEIPDDWRSALRRWSGMNKQYKHNGWPDANTEYFLYQTMLGAWPISLDRLLPYMEKARREAKQITCWTSPNVEFESAMRAFIEGIYADKPFRTDFERFATRLTAPARIHSLAATLLRFTSPGVPDTYQGCELWDLSLVDPDNRRPVDFDLRSKLLEELPRLDGKRVLARMDEGLPKLWTVHHALRVRRERQACFREECPYMPLFAQGGAADHFLGYTRGASVLVAVPRLCLKLGGNWHGARICLPEGVWRHELCGKTFNGGELSVAKLFGAFPVALLTKQ